MDFKTVYSTTDKAKFTPQEAQRCVKALYKIFYRTVMFTPTSLF